MKSHVTKLGPLPSSRDLILLLLTFTLLDFVVLYHFLRVIRELWNQRLSLTPSPLSLREVLLSVDELGPDEGTRSDDSS